MGKRSSVRACGRIEDVGKPGDPKPGGLVLRVWTRRRRPLELLLFVDPGEWVMRGRRGGGRTPSAGMPVDVAIRRNGFRVRVGRRRVRTEDFAADRLAESLLREAMAVPGEAAGRGAR